MRSHTVTDAGTAHHSSNSSTTINPDGSTAGVKQEAKRTAPKLKPITKARLIAEVEGRSGLAVNQATHVRGSTAPI
jgi:hypothetical protein